jgi:uridine phosphorylase
MTRGRRSATSRIKDLDPQVLTIAQDEIGAGVVACGLVEMVAEGGECLGPVIARGVRGVIACGAAGALVPDLVMGHAVVLTGAVRDEGTSFHYLPAGRVVSADPGPAESLADALSAAGVETTHGLSWSMDAIYRETRARVSRRVEEGCLVVEMEASALMAIARYRSIPFGEVVMAGDSLAGREWQHRGWMTAKSARRHLFASAADAAVALTR